MLCARRSSSMPCWLSTACVLPPPPWSRSSYTPPADGQSSCVTKQPPRAIWFILGPIAKFNFVPAFMSAAVYVQWNWHREVKEPEQRKSLRSLCKTAGSQTSALKQKGKKRESGQASAQMDFLGCVFCKALWKALRWKMIFHSMHTITFQSWFERLRETRLKENQWAAALTVFLATLSQVTLCVDKGAQALRLCTIATKTYMNMHFSCLIVYDGVCLRNLHFMCLFALHVWASLSARDEFRDTQFIKVGNKF